MRWYLQPESNKSVTRSFVSTYMFRSPWVELRSYNTREKSAQLALFWYTADGELATAPWLIRYSMFQHTHIVVLGIREYNIQDQEQNSTSYMIMNEGWTQDSNTPSKNRTTIRDLKSFAAAEHAITTPQRKTLEARYFATGSFWSNKLVGYSPTSTPM